MRTLLLPPLLILCGCAHYEVSPLAAAARTGDVAVIRSLARSGSDLEAPSGVNGWTPLMHAVHKRQRASVEALLNCGAKPDSGDGHRVTALMMAAGYGYEDIVGVLLRHGADPYRRDVHQSTAFDYARKGMVDIDRFTFGREQSSALHELESARH
jgi:ankyrin repeat protein